MIRNKTEYDQYFYGLAAVELQEKAEPVIIPFLDRFLQSGFLFDNIQQVRSWLTEVYPQIWDESEQDEQLISAYVAGMLHLLINIPGTGVRWIRTVDHDNEDNDTPIIDSQALGTILQFPSKDT